MPKTDLLEPDLVNIAIDAVIFTYTHFFSSAYDFLEAWVRLVELLRSFCFFLLFGFLFSDELLWRDLGLMLVFRATFFTILFDLRRIWFFLRCLDHSIKDSDLLLKF